MKFICLTLLIISGITDSISERYEVVGSADPVFAVAGEDVILPCSVKPNISVVDMRVEWFRSDLKDSQLVHLYEDNEVRNREQIQSYRERTKLNHPELQRGDASLKLSSVRVSDEGLYKCFIQSKSWSDDTTVDVRVEAVGRPPVITVDGFDHSGGLHLQCESEGWYPEPDLEWLDSEGVSLSSETTETHRNTDRFSVKHTITVHHSDDKIHCRVRLRHHMLETLIISSSNMFSSWRTSVIMISVFVVLSVIAGILIAVFARKNRDHDRLQNEKSRLQNEKRRLQHDHDRLQNEKSTLQNEKRRLQHDHDRLQNEKSTLQYEKRRLQHDHDRLQNEKSTLQNEKSRLQHERDQLKTIIPQALTHSRTHKVNVILDADSAHPRLTVSDDGKQVRDGKRRTERVDGGKDRFDIYLGVLGKDGFSSGCFYFEVQVKGQTWWDLGVSRESVRRKGSNSLSPVNGYWTVGQFYGVYQAHESSSVSLSLSVNPQRIGVFVNYEKGLVFFYDVESMSLIYSFTNQSFKEKLFPFVSLGHLYNEDPTPLIICDDY
ncbi:butyrophilin subfamily 1 member A1-like isoform X1 [Carassius auratus]|uniref:Butyrophilin subfamily 1 member A1-like isoform X1 n=1 Tax=Carassius auratus TaxID=7957 RepID=A0A6P6K231_CARAU|nr:butyrophilin subfamily 1 member A1-like isoform X1 [Carassius auratus]